MRPSPNWTAVSTRLQMLAGLAERPLPWTLSNSVGRGMLTSRWHQRLRSEIAKCEEVWDYLCWEARAEYFR